MRLVIVLLCTIVGINMEDFEYSDDKDLKRDNDYLDPDEMAELVRGLIIIITNGFDDQSNDGVIMMATLKELISYLRSVGNKVFLSEKETNGFRAVGTEFPEGPPFLYIKYDDQLLIKKFGWSYEDLQLLKYSLIKVKYFWKKAYRNAFMRKCRLWPEIEI